MANQKCPYCGKNYTYPSGTVIHCRCGATLHVGPTGTITKKEPPKKK